MSRLLHKVHPQSTKCVLCVVQDTQAPHTWFTTAVLVVRQDEREVVVVLAEPDIVAPSFR